MIEYNLPLAPATAEDLTIFRDYLHGNLNESSLRYHYADSVVPVRHLLLTHIISGESVHYLLYTAHLGHADDASLYIEMFDSTETLTTITCKAGMLMLFAEDDTFVIFGNYKYSFL